VLLAAVATCLVLSVIPALAQGTTTQYYVGPFQGNVVIQDGQAPGRPGYYYYPEATQYPTFSERYDHPVRCLVCGHWRDLGEACPYCGAQPSQDESRKAQQGAVYSPYPLPGQYWYQKPMRTILPPTNIGWPYINPSTY